MATVKKPAPVTTNKPPVFNGGKKGVMKKGGMAMKKGGKMMK